jgi:hypothetical protein
MAVMAGAAQAQPANDAPPLKPVVIEMFLSQSCKSSPPAARHLSEIARRDDVVALAWHVDYWNATPGFETGVWADPFARREYSERQKTYNVRLRKRATVTTPQAVIDGVLLAVGSKRDALEARIVEAQFIDEHARSLPPRLEMARGEKNMYRVNIDGVGAPYDAYAVSFRPRAVTEIAGGDNAGSVFEEINVVTGVETLAKAAEGAQTLSFKAPEGGDDCAVLVQERGQGRVVAARYCASRLTH